MKINDEIIGGFICLQPDQICRSAHFHPDSYSYFRAMKMSTRSLLLIITIFISSAAQSQRRVIFPSKDGLTMYADLYETDRSNPYLVLLHMARSSRGEYREIAKRLNKLDLNCMAVDLRSGRERNFIPNETNALATKLGLGTRFLDSEPDIMTAIDNAFAIGGKPIILMGSSYTASLALKYAKKNSKIKAVIAFSPGEYFGKDLNVEEAIAGLNKPTFIASSAKERKVTEAIASGVNSSKLITHIPAVGGLHGSESLNPECEENHVYWIQLINFLQKVKEEY
ncbi:MAG: dienelactone hydrolase [Granulosicoccus sp.]|jgi:dienelactone hydrolase